MTKRTTGRLILLSLLVAVLLGNAAVAAHIRWRNEFWTTLLVIDLLVVVLVAIGLTAYYEDAN